jgi:hypothetical protein
MVPRDVGTLNDSSLQQGLSVKGFDMAEWISVNDRLPEPRKNYLVCANTDQGPEVDCAFLNVHEQWIHEGEPTFCHSYYFEVTHWAELPEPPKGE